MLTIADHTLTPTMPSSRHSGLDAWSERVIGLMQRYAASVNTYYDEDRQTEIERLCGNLEIERTCLAGSFTQENACGMRHFQNLRHAFSRACGSESLHQHEQHLFHGFERDGDIILLQHLSELAEQGGSALEIACGSSVVSTGKIANQPHFGHCWFSRLAAVAFERQVALHISDAYAELNVDLERKVFGIRDVHKLNYLRLDDLDQKFDFIFGRHLLPMGDGTAEMLAASIYNSLAPGGKGIVFMDTVLSQGVACLKVQRSADSMSGKWEIIRPDEVRENLRLAFAKTALPED